ncbi:serine/threonine-protein kinase [Saccharomonospora azurea]|uniref:serine/threonine-protein kinase n=1 Tax=Saccharomonospora azurea TaxID=40988 RepID=UPI000566BCB4|nr:serine/threonine-protein kinase [Saccharomonospora azurea]
MTEVGELLAGRYRVQRRVGSGAMGTVWQAVDERLGRQVAVKELLLQPGLDAAAAAQARERAHREGRIAARLHHPHAVTVHDVVEHGGLPVLVMEYFPARSLADVLAMDGPLTPRAAADIGAQVAAALAAAHDAGIVHRDIKPANVLLGGDGTAKLADFGIAHAGGDVTVTQTGVVAGTPAYLAPEVARGRPASPASDVFSLGSLLFASVEGVPPFGDSEENTFGVLYRVAGGEPARAHRAGPLTPVLDRLLVDDPTGRPSAAAARDLLRAVADGRTPVLPPAPEELTQPLRAVGPAPQGGGTRLDLNPFHGTPGTAPSPTAVAPSPPRRSRRTALLAVGGGVAAVATVVTIAVASSGSGSTATPTPVVPTTSAPQPPSSAEMLRVVGDHYGHLPHDPHAAFALLGPGLRAQGEQGFAETWSRVRSLTVVSPPRLNGADTVHVGLRLTMRSGATVTEYHQLGVGRDGDAVVIHDDTLLHSETAAPPPPPPDDRRGDGDDDKREKDREKHEEKERKKEAKEREKERKKEEKERKKKEKERDDD